MRACVRSPWSLVATVLMVGLAAADARAQSGRVYGRVVDMETGQPIRSATVVAMSQNAMPGQLTAITDDKGRFSILGLRSGTWILSARAPGYETMAGTTAVRMLGPNPPIEFKLTKMPEPVLSPLASLDLEAYRQELQSAQALLDNSRADDAIKAYEALLLKLPTLTSLNLQIGQAYMLKRDAAGALAAYARIPESDSRYERARIAMGLVELERGNLDAAERILTAIAGAPGASPETFSALGDVRRARQLSEDAARWYAKATEQDPSWASPYMKLAMLASERGDVAAATTYLERAIAVDPDGPDAARAKELLRKLRGQ